MHQIPGALLIPFEQIKIRRHRGPIKPPHNRSINILMAAAVAKHLRACEIHRMDHQPPLILHRRLDAFPILTDASSVVAPR